MFSLSSSSSLLLSIVAIVCLLCKSCTSAPPKMNSLNRTHSVKMKLLKDDEWKRIQQNTFIRWVNQHLKKAPGSPKIENLATDFDDGILLIQLAEVLAQRNLVRFNRKPTMRTQKLDNISTVLNFFQKEEHIKIVNIDSSHIVDHNLKLILGLVWTLILHYSLSHCQPIASAESVGSAGQVAVGNGTSLNHHPSPQKSASSSASEHQQSPRKRLLIWIQERVPHLTVTNFTSDWTNGIVLCALVDACLGSDAFADLSQWNDGGSDALLYTQRAMQVAEDRLDVAKLITPEELTNPNVDEKSVMTYLSQFLNARPSLLSADKQTTIPLINAQQNQTNEFSNDQSSLITEMNQMEQFVENESADSNGGVTTEEATIFVDTVQLTQRHDELHYEPLVGLSQEEMVSADPTDHIEETAMLAVEGHGLQGFVPGQTAKFTVDISKMDFAFPMVLLVGVVTSRGPADKVTVEHVGGGRYEVSYIVQDDMNAFVFVKYGENNVEGSPFSVRPMHFPDQNGEAFRAEVQTDEASYYRM